MTSSAVCKVIVGLANSGVQPSNRQGHTMRQEEDAVWNRPQGQWCWMVRRSVG
jgi:hypothetical protein